MGKVFFLVTILGRHLKQVERVGPELGFSRNQQTGGEELGSRMYGDSLLHD